MSPHRLHSKFLCWVLVASVTWLSCNTTSRKPVEIAVGQLEFGSEHVTVIAMSDGTVVHFDPPGAQLQRSASGSIIIGRVEGQEKQYEIGDVERAWVEVIRTDGGKTFLVTILSLAVFVGVVFLVALATKESCPFIYSWDGEKFVFDAEPYGGATSKGLERTDYSELEHLKAHNGEYRLKVTNEVRETQNTNQMELWVVDHPVGWELAADENGVLHTIHERQPPLWARNSQDRDLTPWLQATDELIWEPAPGSIPTQDRRDTIELAFARPQGAGRMKLVSRVSTGQWGSHMIREFLGLHGDAVDEWYELVDNDTGVQALVHQWASTQELYRLKVELQIAGEWVVRGAIPGGGPFISENRVVELDIGDVRGDEVKIRIRPPLGFWALNSFAADYSLDGDLSIRRIAPKRAITSNGEDVLQQLLLVDDAYYSMPRTGDSGEVVFDAPEAQPGMQRTIFLNTTGYYQLHLDKGRKPDRERLYEISTVDGAAARFAETLYLEYLEKSVP